jgi:membrane protein YdbS with pleckstrin-like domain
MSQRLDLADAEWRRVSPKQIVVEVLGSVIVVVIAGAAAVTFFMVGLGIPALVLGVIAVSSLITALFVPRRVRSYGYLLRDDDLLFRRGLLFQRFVAVPYGRMQLVDITRGPLARIMGLADLKLVTAASTSGVAIPGLAEPDAAALRDRLVELAETRRVGL